MKYDINSSYEARASHPKDMTDNPVTYITLDYATEGIGLIIHNIYGEVV